jgi:E3 ubiquitin-protein ligase HUWE1
VSRRILETLTYLSRNHPSVAKILLQFRLPHPALLETENTDQARGKAVMVVEEYEMDRSEHQEGYISIALLLGLLNQPLYLRSIAHLEQVRWYFGFLLLAHSGMLAEIVLHSGSFLQLLNLLEVIIDNAESKSDLSDKSGESASEHTSGPEILASDVGMNRESGQISSGAAATSKDVDSPKPTTSGAHKEFDTRIVLLNLPQAELRLLCSLLAREGYDVAFGLYKLNFLCH